MADFAPYPSPYGFVQYRPLSLAQPTGLSLEPSCSQIIASCSAVQNASYYYWFIGTASGAEDSSAAQVTTTPTATFAGLNSETVYYVTVKAFNQGIYSVASAEQSATPSCGDVVSAPTFSPPAGTYEETQTVTISTVTSGATIYYTTDGSIPTRASNLYSTPITVAANLTLKAFAIESGLTDSSVTSGAYSIIQAQLSGLSWLLPCLSSGTPCPCAAEASSSATLMAPGGTSYSVTLLIRGFVELQTYSGGTNDGNYWQTGGSPTVADGNTYQLTISSPAQTYYINRGTSAGPTTVLDYQETVTIDAGAIVTLTATSGDDLENPNSGNLSAPDNVPGYPIVVTQPYNGQFAQVDALSVTLIP